jgi:hypothetical protein
VTVGDWRDEAACSGAPDPDLWFSVQPEQVAAAMAVCDSCPVWEACLNASLTMGTPDGIWGGYGPQDRLDLGLIAEDAGYWPDEAIAAERAHRRRRESDWRVSLGERGHMPRTGT